MSKILQFTHGDDIDNNLVAVWQYSMNWYDFIINSGEGIVSYEYSGNDVRTITFESEEHKNWYLLKWS
jgi:hypothetical protein